MRTTTTATTDTFYALIIVLRINFRKNHKATWSVTVLSFHAGNFCGILGIHAIKSIIGDKVLWFGQYITFSFNYNLFLLKEQNQYAKKFTNTHTLLHPINRLRGCKTTELNVFCDVEPLKLKLRLSQ